MQAGAPQLEEKDFQVPDSRPADFGRRRMRARGLACALIATVLVPVGWPTAASAHGRSKVTQDERRLRAQETRVLGAAHAADHARQRAARRDPAARRRKARLRSAFRREKPTARAAASPSEEGRWAPPFPIPAIGIHASLLPTGKVLWFYRTAEDVQRGQATLWDPATGAFEQVPPPLIDGRPANIFCAGQSLLPDGRLLVMGGQLGDNPRQDTQFKGLDAVFTFNPYNETWTRQPNMSGGRWYPTQVLLPDGRTVVIGGYDAGGVVGAPHNPDVEVFTPSPDLDGVGTVTVVGRRGETGPPTGGLYPHLFSMPSGRTLIAGPRPSDSWFLDAIGSGSLSWSDIADPLNHAFGTGVILPAATAESATKVALIAGGLEAGTHVQVFDETAPASGWTTAPALNVPRSHHNTVLLPDGSMVTVGGGRGDIDSDKSLFLPEHLSVELYDPATGTWRQGPAQQEGRAYHSTALLLPDGRVVSAGDDTNGGDSTDTAEIYSPPYLFRGPRPAVTAAPAGVGYGQDFTASIAGSDVASAVLVAPGATTHAVDMSQRYVPLRITGRAEGSVTLAAPAKAELAPPGHYMLFLLNAEGVPSEARFVHLSRDAATAPPPPVPDPPAVPPGTDGGTQAPSPPAPIPSTPAAVPVTPATPEARVVEAEGHAPVVAAPRSGGGRRAVTAARALREARTALRRVYRTAFSKGERFTGTCRRSTATRRTCTVSWRYKRWSYRGRVVVLPGRDRYVTTISVKRTSVRR